MKKILLLLFVFASVYAEAQIQYLGAPNVTVVNRGNFRIDSILYLPKREKTPTDTGALRYQISDSSLYVWTGNAWRKAKNDGTVTSVSAGTGMSFATITSTGSVSADTNVLATKSYKQKGDDSLGAIIATKGTGTVTSVGSGYGINGGTITTTGTLTADTLNLATRLRLQKVGDSLGVLISEAGGGTVTGVSAGIGMSFTTITSSGAVNADTAILSTKAWRQKGIDSVSQNLGLYLPLTGGTLTGGLTGTTAAFNSSGSGNTFSVTHSSGSGIGVNIEKGGNGEGLYINKTSGTGNAATIIGTLNATTLVKSGGTSSQYLMADGTTSTLTNPVTGTGTTNRLAKFTGTSTIGDGGIVDERTSEAVRITSNGNVGVGITANNPLGSGGTFRNFMVGNGAGYGAFQGVSTATTSGSTMAAFMGGTSTASSSFKTAAYMSVELDGESSTNATGRLTFTVGQPVGAYLEAMRITSAGNVAIGNTSPSYKLDISGTLRNTTGAAFATSSGNVLIGKTVDAGVKLDVVGSIANTTGANFATSSGGVRIGDATTSTTRLDVIGGSLTSTSGMSHTGPNGGLNISNTGTLAANRDAQLRLVNGSTFFGASDASYQFINIGRSVTDAALDIQHYSKSTYTRRFRIDTTGNISIGDILTPSERLDVNGRTRIRTIDSTATGMNMLYADANGVIKKAAVPSGGGGTVTSVATGFGLSGGTITTTGTLLVDTASIATRSRVQKGIDSVTTLANTKLSGTGISGYFPKWTGASTQDTSQLFQLGRNIGIGTATPAYRLHLPDQGATLDQSMISGMLFGSDGNGVVMSPGATNLTIKGGNTNGSIYSSSVGGVGHWGINTGTSINDAVFSVNGDVKIVTIDSTSTARNMLYQDANGVIKKAAGLSMADDVMTASGSWVVTKDAGSGFSINNVAYTTNGTTKMVTVDGAFYISAELFSDASWSDVATIPSGFRPQKTVNWTNNFIVSGAEYETTGGTDFTGALSWTYAQMRVTDEGKVQINGSIDTNTIDAGGGDYVVIQFTQSYIIK